MRRFFSSVHRPSNIGSPARLKTTSTPRSASAGAGPLSGFQACASMLPRRRRASSGSRLRTTGCSSFASRCFPMRPVAPVTSARIRRSYSLICHVFATIESSQFGAHLLSCCRVFRGRLSIFGVVAALFAVGCLYPPVTQPPPDEKQEVVIPLPYDLAWDAVNAVITKNSFNVQAQDMTNGIIEAAGPLFTLQDADCGKIKGVAGSYAADPEPDSSSVYNFLVRPRGPEATLVEVRATFNSSVKVPLHPATDVDCVSHGIQESNLLREVLVAAKETHRPVFAKQSAPPQQAAASANAQSSGLAHRPPSSIEKEAGQSNTPNSMQQPDRAYSMHGYSLDGNFQLPAPSPR